MAGMLELHGIVARYEGRPVLDAIDLAVPSGQVVSILGPSGGGKTTLLRIVAGLERPAAGRVLLDGRDLAGVPTHERGLGLMFQDYALFPHRDVAGNVGFGLRMAGWDAARVRDRVAELLALVGLPGFERRSVGTLSGGEQQRVALARALAPSPRMLMLDEPMGSLDRALRERLPDELATLFRDLGLTVLYVTHDHDEALRVADRVVLLRGGGIEADGTPEALWSAPPTRATADFLGFRTIADGELRDGTLETPWGSLPAPAGAPAEGLVGLVLRPDALRLDPTGPIGGTVTARRFRGDHVLLVVTPDGMPPLEVEARGGGLPATGERVRVTIDPAGIVLLQDRTAGARYPSGS